VPSINFETAPSDHAMQNLEIGLDHSNVERTTVALVLPAASEAEARLTIQPSRLDKAPSKSPSKSPLRPPSIGASSGFEVQRIFDIVGSLVLLVALAPLLAVIAGVIALTSSGPVIFAHRRLGRDGRSFGCLKFRTMRSGAEAMLPALLASNPMLQEEWEHDHKLTNDPRITRVGRVLRVTSLDELPQLINVLRGEMTLVGPRPIVREELRHYGRYASHYFSVRPGLTGLWQVSGRSSTSYRRRVATDVYYVRCRSLLLDARILLGTLPAVFSAQGSC